MPNHNRFLRCSRLRRVHVLLAEPHFPDVAFAADVAAFVPAAVADAPAGPRNGTLAAVGFAAAVTTSVCYALVRLGLSAFLTAVLAAPAASSVSNAAVSGVSGALVTSGVDTSAATAVALAFSSLAHSSIRASGVTAGPNTPRL